MEGFELKDSATVNDCTFEVWRKPDMSELKLVIKSPQITISLDHDPTLELAHLLSFWM